MAYPIQIPRLGWSMEEGVFVEWLKADGDTIEPGDLLFNLEGEKAIQEIESIDVDRQISFGRHCYSQLDQETVGLMQIECFVSRNHRPIGQLDSLKNCVEFV